jgi:hypothetical protein
MLTLAASACLMMLVSASWTIRYSVVSDVGRFGERLHESLERRDQSEVVECLRPQLNGQAADVLQRRDHELTEVGGGLPQVVGGAGVFDRSQAQEDRCQRLARLVV